MLNEICLDLNNFFDKGLPKFNGDFVIESGKITDADFLDAIKDNQYFRIIGSVFNDGVFQYTDELELIDEDFSGSIWLLAIPREFLSLVADIEAWQAKNGSVDSAAMSPFYSESFGGYSYSKSAGSVSGTGASTTWQTAYKNRLNIYRRIKGI